jgi:amino acid adenylation domain-containing protein
MFSAAEPFSRDISPSEWWMLSTPRGRAAEVQLCVEGYGDIDPAALAAAVAAASQACPGARLVRRGRRWVDSGQPPPVRVADSEPGFDRFRLDSPLLRGRLDRPGALGCEVILVRGAPATVIFRVHHALMDGLGAMIWQAQVFRALRGEAVEGATTETTYAEIMVEAAAALGRELQPLPGKLPFDRPNLLGKPATRYRRSMFRRRVIAGTHPAATAKIARLVTAYGDGRGPVCVPVDARQHLPGLRTTVTASGLLRFPIGPDEDWNDVHATLLTAMNEYQYLIGEAPPSPLSLSAMRAVRNAADKAGRQKGTCDAVAVVSHLGAVDLADFCAPGFEATGYYSLGSVNFPAEFNIVESQGKTELTVAWFDGPGVGERAEALLDWVAGQLSPPAHADWDGNRTARDAPPATLTQLFAEQAGRTPDALAVSGPDGDLTYAELSRRSAALAAALRARGIGRDDRVGLVAGRSAAAITAIWGILRAGAAYLPIDVGYPEARIAQLLTDAGAALCLLESPGQPRGFLPPGCSGVSLDALSLETGPGEEADVRPEDLANVIYTSGSTGAPKGVEIEHRSMVNYVRWVTREAGIDASVRMPLIASISFDMAGCAIFLPLLAGGTVLPVREVNALTLREVLEDGRANVLAITPSHLELINQSGIRRSSMRVVMTAGELLRRSTAVRARELFGPDCRILCQWGPTETTIVNTSHEFDPATDTGPGVPFGRPMDNNTVYLLDAHGRPVPPGEPGEAYLGGVQVARGYLGRPDLTRQRFIRLADGTRVYRTGDIARLLPTGELSFVSRIDDQVKVAGHRVEPAEVAQVLEEHPAVRQAAVVPRSRPGRSDKELCGYVVCDADGTPAALKEFLAGRLPGYMIPAVLLVVDDIPRNANGKTDVRRLPDPFAGACGGTAAVPGRDDVTNAVARIWAQTLQVDAHLIDEQTDFRQLGGNSILLLAMIEEVSKSVAGDGAEFMSELGRIIREPTLGRVSGLARQVRAGQVRAGQVRAGRAELS